MRLHTHLCVCAQRFDHIDCLINNAGVFAGREREETKEGHELTYGINVQALYLVTCLLLKKVGVGRLGHTVGLTSSPACTGQHADGPSHAASSIRSAMIIVTHCGAFKKLCCAVMSCLSGTNQRWHSNLRP